jgi:hypothetical protein
MNRVFPTPFGIIPAGRAIVKSSAKTRPPSRDCSCADPTVWSRAIPADFLHFLRGAVGIRLKRAAAILRQYGGNSAYCPAAGQGAGRRSPLPCSGSARDGGVAGRRSGRGVGSCVAASGLALATPSDPCLEFRRRGAAIAGGLSRTGRVLALPTFASLNFQGDKIDYHRTRLS